ncbi:MULTISPECIES: hypothetical protein [Aerosakkonema]
MTDRIRIYGYHGTSAEAAAIAFASTEPRTIESSQVKLCIF